MRDGVEVDGFESEGAAGDQGGEPCEADADFADIGHEAEVNVCVASNGEDGEGAGTDEHDVPESGKLKFWNRRSENQVEDLPCVD